MPRHTESNLYSITVRPRGGIDKAFPSWMETIKAITDEYKDVMFYFAREDNGTAESSHVQGMMSLPTMIRQDNLRRSFVKVFPGVDTAEKRQMICVRTHNSIDILLGYCQKQGGLHITNIPKEVLIRSKGVYDATKKVTAKKDSRYDLHDQVIDYMIMVCTEAKIPMHYIDVDWALTALIRDRTLKPSEYIRIKKLELQNYWVLLTLDSHGADDWRKKVDTDEGRATLVNSCPNNPQGAHAREYANSYRHSTYSGMKMDE